MSSSEFSVIDEFFTRNFSQGLSPALGIGDDCAVLDVPKGKQLAVSTDTLLEGVHFLPNSDPQLLGHKVLAVNLSDLAAVGATPVWASLAITLPVIDKVWLSKFSQGFFELAEKYALQLVGGDTTCGPLSITVTIMGLLPQGMRLTRAGARPGDSIYVSNTVGNAGLGLEKAKAACTDIVDEALVAYLSPNPRIELGCKLLGLASSCIDISDGLSADLNHILKASGVGATVSHESLPLTQAVRKHMAQDADWLWPYSTGDDYELCFTVPSDVNLDGLKGELGESITKIGVIEEEKGLRIQTKDGEQIILNKGYDHFNDKWNAYI